MTATTRTTTSPSGNDGERADRGLRLLDPEHTLTTPIQNPPSKIQHPSGIADPLPKQFLTDTTGVGGRIKVRPEDFLVDELPLYEPEGKGEHLYLGIQKNNVAHGELVACLRKHFGVLERDIGYAGMKDKVGITRQTVSVHLLTDPPVVDIGHARIQVLWSERHRNKIRRGHLAGNRFSIRIREVDPLKAPIVQRTLRALEGLGVPNYFGSQRFGYRCNNHLIGGALLHGDWKKMLDLLLGTKGGNFPEYQRERRELYDAGKVEQAAVLWTASDRAERIACNALAKGKKNKEAVARIGENALSFWISALQSAMFNRVLDWRLENKMLASLVEGDLAWKHSTGGIFPVTQPEIESGELPRRLNAMEISPSGPLWGTGMMQPPGTRIAEVEHEALQASGIPLELMLNGRRSPEGGRRPLRTILKDPEIDAGLDDHGQYIRVAFDLPRGSYATVVLREIMKGDREEPDDQST